MRLARSSGSRSRVTAAGKPRVAFVLALACGLPAAACERPPSAAEAEKVSVEWQMTPGQPIAGATTRAEVTLRDSARRPIRGAQLRVEGHMSHPGMAPLIAAAAERNDGVYQVELQFTMRGEWILLITGELPDGRRINHQVDVIAAGPAR
jgi:hypothetical protein